MSQFETLITSLEADVKKAEEGLAHANAQLAQWTANVHGITGMLQASKKSLADAQALVEKPNLETPISESEQLAD